ncbi:MAG: GNAT family N-acetyltransferase [Proteobacteria bacterium]|nr:GNAT family N-acetyltransferase [Pseudomonadota bacterium]
MQIQDFQIGDETKILDLFQSVYKKPMRSAYWQWRFGNNPAGKHMIKLMWHNETLVGHYAVSPVFMRIAGEKQLTALSVSTMTHPDYGGRGIFRMLAKSLYDTLESEKNIKVIWGFPNTNSHYGFIKHLGWGNVGIVHMLNLDVSGRKTAPQSKIFLMNSFSTESITLLQAMTEQFPVAIERELTYLNWRYIHHPTQQYAIFEHRDRTKNLKAVTVTKAFQSSAQPEMYEIFILELGMVEHYDELPDFLNDIVAFYEKPVSKINIWMSLWDRRHIMLEKIGFLPTGRTAYLGARSSQENLPVLSDPRNWFLSMGDSDVY